ncbi:MAG: Hsp20/alpha crystallin family protein [Spirochaetia bacterium]|nr:Hsp20/alpha crystallin family protein [Treponema sp.]MCI6365561.1 Hsp20/alpha crystallin family protein [Spirochaetia bacterium]MBR0544839.1 Hsp20/alpha crystallin family protein [Treponema sp.]MCI6546168.1 Hsp20/alpha crystallin family protein [Spirochaetia bacterium]MCI7436319.1 Hsp20/alpha crystallin family protein [Spirochaetia bacterium]
MNELSLFDSLFNNTMDSVFNNYRTVSVPKVDVKETENAYSLDMELPGRTENDVNIELDHNTLTISSKKEETTEKSEGTEKNNNSGKWLIRERRTSEFSRSFRLPEDVDNENVKATFKNGILNVMMPRKALATPKRIAIECA